MNETKLVKEWANPTPAGLVALAVACFGFFALLSGKVDPSAMPLLGIWLLGGFVVQIVVGLIDLKGGNTTGGNTFIFFCAFFMFVSGLEMIFKFNIANSGIKIDSHLDGWAWAALTLVMYAWTPAFFKTPALLAVIVFALDIALPFICLTDMGVLPASYKIISAWAFLVAGITGVYLSAAIIVNTAFGKNVYPNPGPIIK